MSVLGSVLAASFCLTIVFVVLAGLYGFIRLFSFGISIAVSKKKQCDAAVMTENKPETAAEAMAEPITDGVLEKMSAAMLEERQVPDGGSTWVEGEFAEGSLKLVNVDERTAAMIMAIVSHESGIPLSELCFKSIKEIPKDKGEENVW